MNNLLIFGGTFDPVHNGHIQTALTVQNHFNFDRFIFLPCKIPVLKAKALATPKQRIDMLKLALDDQTKHFEISSFEIEQNQPSYTVDTLSYFRKQLGENTAITFLLGADSFLQLPQWHAWQKLLELANLLVIQRSGFNENNLPNSLKALVAKQETFKEEALKSISHGLIYRYDAGCFDISSSQLRKQLSTHYSNSNNFLPEAVFQYIQKNHIYHS